VASGLGGLAVVVTGAWLVRDGELPAVLLPLLTLLALSSFLPVSEIAQVGRQLADTLGATRRLHAVHGHEVAVRDGHGVNLDASLGLVAVPALALDNVSFRYDAQHVDALSDASIEVPAGHTLALVGPSGAGKTTIAHLLLRFWDPGAGAVRLHGHDLREFRLQELLFVQRIIAREHRDGPPASDRRAIAGGNRACGAQRVRVRVTRGPRYAGR